ncbi:hypothetical protein PG984_012050 [Apiospora sp. TS-2023a]
MVSLTDGQKATLSPEAVEFITNIHHIPFAQTLAPFIASPRRVVTIAGLSVTVITPANIEPEKQNKLLFNVFGGATIMGSPRDRGALTMAAELGVRVCSPDYTKAPEARYPVARDQCLAVYRELIQKGLPPLPSATSSSSTSPPLVGPVDPANMYAMGSSSGAQVLVSMLLVARREGLPLPTAGLYLCTPALDLSGAGDSMTSNARDRDIMPVSLLTAMVTQNYVPLPGVEVDGKVFGGTTDPLYSPLYADYTTKKDDGAAAAPWFPRTVMTVGTRDFALSNGVRFYWKLREAGVEVELLVSEGMWHGFNWDPKVPEALTARAAVVDFLERRTS